MGGLLAAGSRTALVALETWAGWAGRVAGSVSYTLGPEAGWQVAGWAGPEACRRHVRHASRRAEGLGLTGWHTLRPVSHTAPKGLGLLHNLGPDVSRRSRPDQPGLSCLEPD